MLWKVIFSILLAVVVQHIVKLCILVGYHRSVLYRHSPGQCRVLMEGGGSEDLTVLKSGVTFISHGVISEDGTGSSILMFDFNDPRHELTNLKVAGTPYRSDVIHRPLGVSVYEDPDSGAVTLFVIMYNRTQPRLEVFGVDVKARLLHHKKTIVDPSFGLMNDLVAIDNERFYITKTSYMREPWHLLEIMLLLRTGSVLFYDGQTFKTVASQIQLANGVNVSPDKSHVYVVETGQRQLLVYQRKTDHTLDLVQTVYTDSGLDNVEVDAKTGDLWVAGHPASYLTFQCNSLIREGSKEKCAAPSQVFHMKTKNGLVTDVIEVYLNNGTELTGSSVANFYKGRLLVGSIAHQLLLCDAKLVD